MGSYQQRGGHVRFISSFDMYIYIICYSIYIYIDIDIDIYIYISPLKKIDPEPGYRRFIKYIYINDAPPYKMAIPIYHPYKLAIL